MRVFIPGGSGFLGNAVRQQLIIDHHEVVTSGRSPTADIHLDVADTSRSQLEELLADLDADAILNLVGTGLSSDDVTPDVQAKVNGVWPGLLASYARDYDNVTLVHVASSTELNTNQNGHYESLYSETKSIGSREVLRIHGEAPQRSSLIYAHNIYGPTQPRARLVRWLIEHAASQSQVTLRYPNRVRDFVYVDDAAAAIASSITDPAAAHGREVGTAKGTRLQDLAHSVFSLMGADPELIEIEMAGDQDAFGQTVADPNNLLRFATVELQEGLVRTIDEVERLSK